MSRWTESFFKKAYEFYRKGMLERSFEWFLRGANAGDASCMIWVGILYGDGVKEDNQNNNEILWYKCAWKKGDLAAPNNIAIVYKNQKRHSIAERWFKVAIQAGDGDANLELAKMLIRIGRNRNEIHKYLTATIHSKYVTENSVEESQRLLDKYA